MHRIVHRIVRRIVDCSYGQCQLSSLAAILIIQHDSSLRFADTLGFFALWRSLADLC